MKNDRLSDLHDDVLIHIQSFLDVKSAAQTCVLSKRWNNKLWIHHQDVYLNSETFGRTSRSFEEFVDMVLAQRDKLLHKIRSFTFNWKFKSSIPQQLLDKVHDHVQYHDVQNFDLSICSASCHRSYPPQKFNPKPLTTLRWKSLNGFQGSYLYFTGCIALKTLSLAKIWFEINSGDVDLFSSLVNLTELHIIGWYIIGQNGRFLIGAPRLERLTILQNISVPHWDISTRVLKYLRTDLKVSKHTIKQLPPYIEELEIDFPSYINCRTADRLINKIRCLPHAKSVTLSKSILQIISASPEILDSRFPATLPQFKWEFLKVITTNKLPTNEYSDYRPGLAALMKNCSKTLKLEFV